MTLYGFSVALADLELGSPLTGLRACRVYPLPGTCPCVQGHLKQWSQRSLTRFFFLVGFWVS